MDKTEARREPSKKFCCETSREFQNKKMQDVMHCHLSCKNMAGRKRTEDS